MNRVIRKSQAQSSREAEELLAGLFAAELVRPSKCIWLVSPWISDVDIIDNSASGFPSLRRFGPRRIRLTEVLCVLAEAGSQIVIATTPDESNGAFRRRLDMLARDLLVGQRVRVVVDPAGLLHSKAVTADDFAVGGSMNITNNGIRFREEQVELHTDPEYVATAKMDAYDRFQGLL